MAATKERKVYNPDAPATKRQLWYLHILTKQDTRDLDITRGEISKWIAVAQAERVIKMLQLETTPTTKPAVEPEAPPVEGNVTVLQVNLAAALAELRKVAPKEYRTLPAVEYVLIKTEGSKITLSATDLETYKIAEIDGRVYKPLAVCVKLHILHDWVQACPDDAITIKSGVGTVRFRCQREIATFSTLKPEEFPPAPSGCEPQPISGKPKREPKVPKYKPLRDCDVVRVAPFHQVERDSWYSGGRHHDGTKETKTVFKHYTNCPPLCGWDWYKANYEKDYPEATFELDCDGRNVAKFNGNYEKGMIGKAIKAIK